MLWRTAEDKTAMQTTDVPRQRTKMTFCSLVSLVSAIFFVFHRQWWRSILVRLTVAASAEWHPDFCNLNLVLRSGFFFCSCCHHLFFFTMARLLIVLQYACGASHARLTSCCSAHFVGGTNLVVEFIGSSHGNRLTLESLFWFYLGLCASRKWRINAYKIDEFARARAMVRNLT